MDNDCLTLLPSVCEVLADSKLLLHDDTCLEKLLDCFKKLIMQNGEQYFMQYMPCLLKFLQSITNSQTVDPSVFSFSLKLAGLLASTEDSFTLLEDKGVLAYMFQPDSWCLLELWKDSSVRYGWLHGLWNMLQHPQSLNFFCKNGFIDLVLQLQNDKGFFITSLTSQILTHVLNLITPNCCPVNSDFVLVEKAVITHIAASLASEEKDVIIPALRLLATVLTQCREPLKKMFWKHVVGPLEVLAGLKDDSFTLPIMSVLQAVASPENLKRKATDVILLPLLRVTASPLQLHDPDKLNGYIQQLDKQLYQKALCVCLLTQGLSSTAEHVHKISLADIPFQLIASSVIKLLKICTGHAMEAGVFPHLIGCYKVQQCSVDLLSSLTVCAGDGKYAEALHRSDMISVIFTSLSDSESYVQASAVTALGEAVTTPDVGTELQEKAVTHLLSVLSQETQSFPRRAALKVCITWLKSPHCCTALEQSISAVLLLGGKDFDWEVKVHTLELADALMDKSLGPCPCHFQKSLKNSESPCIMHTLTKLKDLGVLDFLFKCILDCDRPVSQKACSLMLKLRTLTRGITTADCTVPTVDICKYHWNEEMLQRSCKHHDKVQAGQVDGADSHAGAPKMMDLCQVLEILDLENMQHDLSLSSDHVINSPQSLMEDILFMSRESEDNVADCY
ncbi:BRCA1-associated ATM activator 1 [Bagarius yarrelli]|uniref:BRCA1-associated ATM activator 1 n=1 Tax=Bagarius yarrelli TaxID=175774 RepID=A0A556TKA2_BAGYA|nr:BRCA1-associated ATM activator 1 [Bagarius yarrelli]